MVSYQGNNAHKGYVNIDIGFFTVYHTHDDAMKGAVLSFLINADWD